MDPVRQIQVHCFECRIVCRSRLPIALCRVALGFKGFIEIPGSPPVQDVWSLFKSLYSLWTLCLNKTYRWKPVRLQSKSICNQNVIGHKYGE